MPRDDVKNKLRMLRGDLNNLAARMVSMDRRGLLSEQAKARLLAQRNALRDTISYQEKLLAESGTAAKPHLKYGKSTDAPKT